MFSWMIRDRLRIMDAEQNAKIRVLEARIKALEELIEQHLNHDHERFKALIKALDQRQTTKNVDWSKRISDNYPFYRNEAGPFVGDF